MMPSASCPQCQKPVTKEHAPFCSKRCAQLDLGKWLNESHIVQGTDYDAFSSDEILD